VVKSARVCYLTGIPRVFATPFSLVELADARSLDDSVVGQWGMITGQDTESHSRVPVNRKRDPGEAREVGGDEHPFGDDRRWLDRILGGDPYQAWEEIFHRFSALVKRVLMANPRIRAEGLEEDGLQEIFITLQKDDFARLRKWRGDASLDSFMRVVVQHLAQDFLRSEGRARMVPLGPDDEVPPRIDPPARPPTPEVIIDLERILQAARECQEGLSPRDQKLIELKHTQELSYREIADRMRMTVNNVGVALGRAEVRLKRCLQERYPDFFEKGMESTPEKP